MDGVKWIKIFNDIFNNRKIKQIEKMPEGDAIIVVWLKLLCLAGTCNQNGMLYLTDEIPYTDEMLAIEFNMENRITTLKLALRTFVNFGMIEIIDNVFNITNWNKYQNIEGLEKIREQNRIRQERYRKNKKLLLSNVTDNVTDNGNVTSCNALDKDIDKDIDKELDIDIKESKEKSKRFVPPTLEEVQAYCKERNNNIDAEQFIDFYASKGWKVGDQSMKDWKAAVRTWEKREKFTAQSQKQQTINKFNQFPQRTYTAQDYADIEKKLLNKNL